ncbi:MAG: MotA/TolQ/ExbB proton channel family protein [candidate division WOR-3 bacterium]
MIMGQSLYQVFAKSFVMVILLACSIAALALIIERFWYFTRNRFNIQRDLAELRRLLAGGGYGQALEWSRTRKNPLGRMFTVALDNITLNAEELADLTYSLVLEERVRYERLLGGLGTLANAATLLGLLGTVTGLIGAFSNIAATGSGGPAVVSKGIAEALLTTAFGLLIGIPVLFFYNYFAKKAGDLTMSLESASDRLIVMLQRFKAQEGEIPTSPAPRPTPQPRTTPAEDTAWKF